MPSHCRWTLAAMLLAGSLLGGCIDAQTNYTHSGPVWDSAAVKRIEPGHTPRQWVLDTFGEPTSRTKEEGGSEMFKYVRNQTKDSRFDMKFLLPLIDAHEVTQTRYTLYIEIDDGVVKRYWRDQSQVDKDSDLDVLR